MFRFFLFFCPALLFIAAIDFYVNNQRLYFKEYKIEINKKQFYQATELSTKALNWEILELDNFIFVAKRVEPFAEAEAQKIHIRYKDEKLFFASIKASFGRNSFYKNSKHNENLHTFLSLLKLIKQGKNARQLVIQKIAKEDLSIKQENPWSLVNILKRIIGYGISLIFLVFSVYGLFCLFIIPSDFWVILLIMPAPLLFIYHYIKSDIQILRAKKRNTNDRQTLH